MSFFLKWPAKFRSTIVKPRIHVALFLVLTFFMMLVASVCHIPGVIDHPQFEAELHPTFVEQALSQKNPIKLYAYSAFFIIDFVWSFILLLGIWRLVKSFYDKSEPSSFGKLCLAIFFVIICTAWVFDCVENTNYLYFSYKEWVVHIKIVLYLVVLLTTLIILIYQQFKGFWPSIIGFLKASVYSLVILAIIGLFLPRAPQVNSIVVDLYTNPRSFLILLLVAPTYAVVLAHYPSYFNIDKTKRDWYRAKIRFGLLGTIFYKTKKRKNLPYKTYNDAVYYKKNDTHIEGDKNDYKPEVGYINFLFRVLGILFYCALFYVIGYASEVNFDWYISIKQLSLVLLGAGVVLLYVLRKKKNNWLDNNVKYLEANLPDFYDGDYVKKEDKPTSRDEKLKEINQEKLEGRTDVDEAELFRINGYVTTYLFAFGITIAAHLALFWILFKGSAHIAAPYSNASTILSLICIALQMVSYIYYRTFRSVFRFTFFDAKNKAVLNAFYILRTIKVLPARETVSEEEIKSNKEKIVAFFKKHRFVEQSKMFGFFRALNFGALSNNITYLQVTVVIGLINAVFLLVINLSDSAALHFNPMLIILSYFFFFYGVIVVLTKNFIYYQYSNEEFAKKNKTQFNIVLALGVLVVLIANTLTRTYSNELFTLKPIERKIAEEVSLNEFYKNLPQDNTPRYYIGAYGGGMKANAWTLTVLNALHKQDSTFFDNTVVISGASGGTMGLINMAAIVNGAKSDSLWEDRIKDISTSNILALDLTHILGRDTFNHLLVPFKDLKGYDRSSKAMNRYAQLSHNADQICNPSAYRAFWKQLYEKRNKKFPILIANSTNVLGNQGMAVSVSTDPFSKEESYLYQGANNILDINETVYCDLKENEKTDAAIPKYKQKELTLSYYDAASTSNRFPLISPAAKIETIGHFNDGGIYENSGLLSAYKQYRAIQVLEEADSRQRDTLKGNNPEQRLPRTVFINIVNDKAQYIKYTVENYVKEKLYSKVVVNRINKNTEINAILGSIASTEMMPIYIKTELSRMAEQENFDFETIYLPHQFTVADIKALYGKEFDFGRGIQATLKEMLDCVQENNNSIKSLFEDKKSKSKTPIIEPPMSRMIAEEAYNFMVKMLQHPTPQKSLKRIAETK